MTASKLWEQDAKRRGAIRQRLPGVHIVTFTSCQVYKIYRKSREYKSFCKNRKHPGVPLRPRDSLLGGIVVSLKSYAEATDMNKIYYIDVTSLYPRCLDGLTD